MHNSKTARRYCKAIMEIAISKNIAQTVNDDMNVILKTLNSNLELTTFLQNPTISIEDKNNVVTQIFANPNSVTKSLFHLLFENKRFEILDEIASEYIQSFNQINGIEIVNVTTAVPMDSKMESQIMLKIATFSDKKIVIKNIVDESIIGGFILRMGDMQYNTSVANKLKVLKKELSQ